MRNPAFQALDDLLNEKPLRTPEEAREFVKDVEAELDRQGTSDEDKVKVFKTVAQAYDAVKMLKNHSRALRERVSEIAREKGL